MRAKQIADALNISTYTVHTHIRNIYDILGVCSMAHAYAAANDDVKQLSELKRLFLGINSPAIKWHPTKYRQPVNGQQVLMKYDDTVPVEGYYIVSKWFKKNMAQTDAPTEWADASLASFESEVAA